MPPKKKEEKEKDVLIGRIGTNLKLGIVGLPNVGKSTFFNVLTKSQAAAENFPFCTIDPNESRVPVPDARWTFLCDFFKPSSKVPAFLNVVDIAGLVQGAHEGQGLGNSFLSHIKACDALIHMSRVFEDDLVTHVEGDVDPVRDLAIIHEELRLKDEEFLLKALDTVDKQATRGSGDKMKKLEWDILKRVQIVLSDQKKAIRFGNWDTKEIEELNKHLFITAKPMIYLINMSTKDYARKKNKWLPKIKEWIDAHDPGSVIIPFSGAMELELMSMDDDQAAAYCKEKAIQSNLEKIITTGYKALGLMYYFTSGEDEVKAWTIQALQLMYFFTVGTDEVKAWTIQKQTKAPQAAGKIHTDFEKGFIMADIMKFEDFKECGSETAVKAAGKYKQKGRDYIVEDGDIIHFKFNAGAGLTGKKK